jgi:UDPglucose 6-dehydrogenase
MRVTVTGLGYLGLVHAATLAEMGNHVLGMDNDEGKMKRIREGQLPFHEPELDELVRKHTTGGRLEFTGDPVEIAKYAGVHFLCVGTPLTDAGAADLRYLRDAVSALAPHFKGERSFIVGKSTTPPGTAAELLQLAQGLAPEGVVVEVAWNPEFLREGTAVQDSLYPDRLVFGVDSDRSELVLRHVYQTLRASGTRCITTDVVTAELSKLASNAFLATKISFINGIAQFTERNGGNPADVARIMGADHRIGVAGLQPGLGYGGGCLPKDVEMLTRVLDDGGGHRLATLLKHATRINAWRRQQVITLAHELLSGDFHGKNIAVLGIAFKAGTSDTRDSPGLYLAHAFEAAGAHVTVHDSHTGECDFDNADSAGEGIRGADLVIVTTNDPEYGKLDPSRFPPGKVIDCRNVLDRGKWESACWEVHETGR